MFPVRFADIDHAGIVYYPVYYHYFHVAFEEMFRDRLGAAGYASLLNDRKIGFPAVSSSCTYRAPLRFGDDVEIILLVTKVGQKSVTFGYRASRLTDSQSEPVADGEIVCAVLDFASFRAIAVPDDLRRLFLELLQDSQVKPELS